MLEKKSNQSKQSGDRMKKIIFGLILLFNTSCYADVVTVDSLVSADDITIQWLNGFKNTVVNALNSFDGENIADNTINVDAFDDNTNIVTRWDESFNNYVISGLLPPTTTGTLTSTTTAGVAYIDGTRVSKDATAHLYTASKDTYVDLSSTGTYTYSEVVNGGAKPATASNSIRLAKVVTDATEVTSVTDMRVLGVTLATSEDFYISGMELLYTDATRVSIDTGVCYVGGTRIEKTAPIGIDISSATNYITGISERATSIWLYAYCDDSGSVKIDNNAPDYHDTSGNTAGTKHYYKYGTEYWRFLSAVYLDAVGSGNVVPFNHSGRWIHYTDPQTFACGTATAFTEIDLTSVTSANTVQANIYASYNANTSRLAYFRNSNSSTDNSQGWMPGLMSDATSSRPFVGIYPVVVGTTYSRAIDYKMSVNDTTLTGYMESFEIER